MKAALPILFIVASSGMLLLAISLVWASFRSLFGEHEQGWVTQSSAVRRRAELLEEKDAVLHSLKDLEFERDAGKIADEDYKRLEAEFRVRARKVLKELDADLKEHREKAERLLEAELNKLTATTQAESVKS